MLVPTSTSTFGYGDEVSGSHARSFEAPPYETKITQAVVAVRPS